MFSKHPQQIEDIIRSIIRQNGLETPLLQRRLLNAWEEVAGASVAAYTTDKAIRNQTLWVKINSPAMRSELSMIKAELVRKLNNKVGGQVICEIRIV